MEIFDNEVISARELYIFLGYCPRSYSRWVKMNLLANKDYKENIDYYVEELVIRGGETKDYILTNNVGKHIAMMSKTPLGKEIRQYFIDVEDIYRKVQNLTPLEIGQLWAKDKNLINKINI